MHQRDAHPVLIQLAAHVGMQHHNPDAAQRAGARQEDAVGLARQRIARRECVFGNKSPDGFATPDGTNAICEIKNPGHFAPETVNFQCKAAHSRVFSRRLDLRGDPLIAGLA